MVAMEGRTTVFFFRCIWCHVLSSHTTGECRFASFLRCFRLCIWCCIICNAQGQVHFSSMPGKARLAPIHQVTIPRLELMAVIAVKQ